MNDMMPSKKKENLLHFFLRAVIGLQSGGEATFSSRVTSQLKEGQWGKVMQHTQWQQHTTPVFRIFLCGGFRAERRAETHYEAVRTPEWGGSNYPRLLLKALVCSPGRQARRDALLTMLWPEDDGEQAVHYLNAATTKLRKALQGGTSQHSFLITEADFTLYRLEGQETLWVDADAAFVLLKDIERQGRMSPEALPLLEEAVALFQQGTFLQDEEGQWAAARRATVEQTRYRCRRWLAEAYEQHHLPGLAESTLSLLLEEDPTDEDVLVRLMTLFHQQGMTQQALRVYRRTVEACAQDGLDLTEETTAFAAQLRKTHHFPARGRGFAENAPSSLVLAHDRIAGDTVRSHRTLEPTALPHTGQSPLYMLTEQQLLNFAAVCRLGEPMMFDPTKRQTLETLLTAMSVALVKPQGLLQAESWKPLLASTTDLTKTNAATIQRLKALIETCWQLSRGNELALVEELLPICMAKVVPLAQQPSLYQQDAINLTMQGFQLSGLQAFHRNDMQTRELCNKQAVQYSRLSGDQRSLIPALRSLGTTYYYKGQYSHALHAYQDALPHIKSVSPSQQACVYISLAVAHAHMDQSQDALTYLGLANDIFPDYPETDPSFSYAEFDLSEMILWEGITRSRLGQTQQALDIFNRIEQPDFTASERLRIEIINQQAKTAILSGDVEQGAAYVETGLTGAKVLGSQRRYSEAYENFQQMRLLWPQEQRVMALGELFH